MGQRAGADWATSEDAKLRTKGLTVHVKLGVYDWNDWVVFTGIYTQTLDSISQFCDPLLFYFINEFLIRR